MKNTKQEICELMKRSFIDDRIIENSEFCYEMCYKKDTSFILKDENGEISGIAFYDIFIPGIIKPLPKHYKEELSYYNYMVYPYLTLQNVVKEKCVYLSVLAIDPNKQGKGYSTLLLNHVKEFAKSQNLNKIVLWTDLHCDHSFYEHIKAKPLKKFNSSGYLGDETNQDNTIIYQIEVN